MKFQRSFLVLLIFLSLNSCVEFVNGVADGVSSKKKESISDSNFNTITIDSLYQLNIPKYMKNMPSLHDEASLEYANVYKETYTVVLDENKQEFIDVFTELEEYDTKLSPIENYKNVQKKMLSESITDFKVQEYGLTTLNEQPARQIKVTGTIDGLGIFYVIGFVEGKENVYMIMNWTLKERSNRYENTFEVINGTFKEL